MAIIGGTLLYYLNFDDSEKTWVATRLLQCHSNPWEKQSISVNQYFNQYGVTIYDSSFKEIKQAGSDQQVVTLGCSSASTSMMFLLVSNKDVHIMKNLGYAVIRDVNSTYSISQ